MAIQYNREMSVDKATVSALTSFPEQLEKLFSAVPEPYIDWTPPSWEGIPSESFSPVGQLCHIRDIEIDGYQVRLRRLLEEVNPTLASLDSYSLAKERRYSDARPGEILAAFRKARGETVETVQRLDDDQLKREGFFEGYGPVTVRGVIHFLCSHDQQHLAGMYWLLGKMESERALGVRAAG